MRSLIVGMLMFFAVGFSVIRDCRHLPQRTGFARVRRCRVPLGAGILAPLGVRRLLCRDSNPQGNILDARALFHPGRMARGKLRSALSA